MWAKREHLALITLIPKRGEKPFLPSRRNRRGKRRVNLQLSQTKKRLLNPTLLLRGEKKEKGHVFVMTDGHIKKEKNRLNFFLVRGGSRICSLQSMEKWK